MRTLSRVQAYGSRLRQALYSRARALSVGCVAFLLAPTSDAQAVSGLDACLAQASANSSDKAQAQCYFQAAIPRETRPAIVDRLAAAIESKPKCPHLWRALGRVVWSADHERGEAALGTAAELFEAQGDWLLAVKTRIIRLTMLERRQLHDRCEEELERFRAAQVQTVSAPASALALSAVSDYQLRAGKHLAGGVAQLEVLPPASIESFAPEVALEVLRTRIGLAQHRLDVEQASKDIELLRRLGETSKNARVTQEVQIQSAYNLYFRATLFPSLSNIEDAAAEIRPLCKPDEVDKSNRNLYYCKLFCELDARLQNEPKVVYALLEQCSNQAKEIKNPKALAECHRLRSLSLVTKNPVESFAVALKGLQSIPHLEASSSVRISVWEQLMRVAWLQRPLPEARIIARVALLEIEFLRSARTQRTLKLGSLALWTSNYRWFASRLMQNKMAPKAKAEAFEIQERSRARSLIDTFNAAKPLPESQDSTNPLRLALQSEVLEWASLVVAQDPNTEPKIQKIRALVRQLEDRAYNNADFISLEKIQSQLEASQAMLSYHVDVEISHDGERIGGSWAMVITRDSATPIKLPADRLMIQRAVRTLQSTAPSQSEGYRGSVDKLKEWLVDPLRDTIPPKVHDLIVIPDGPLYKVPFFALAPKYRYTYTPSATAWAVAKDSGTSSIRPKSLIVADPTRVLRDASPSPDAPASRLLPATQESLTQPLPNSRKEIGSLRKHLGGDLQALQGKKAKVSALLHALQAKPKLIHISAHSVVGQSSASPTAIALTNTEGPGDGLFTTEMIRELPLEGAVVILGGCETGAGQAMAGEGVLSIARAFQEAGARSVVASLWPLRDDLTAGFFEQFYAHLGEGQSLAQALWQAQSSYAQQGLAFESYAPFVVLGDGSAKFTPLVKPRVETTTPKTRWKPLLALTAILLAGVWAFRVARRAKHSRS